MEARVSPGLDCVGLGWKLNHQRLPYSQTGGGFQAIVQDELGHGNAVLQGNGVDSIAGFDYVDEHGSTSEQGDEVRAGPTHHAVEAHHIPALPLVEDGEPRPIIGPGQDRRRRCPAYPGY